MLAAPYVHVSRLPPHHTHTHTRTRARTHTQARERCRRLAAAKHARAAAAAAALSAGGLPRPSKNDAARVIQAGVRGMLMRTRVRRDAEQELAFIGMRPRVRALVAGRCCCVVCGGGVCV
jgi:hypothetical protein